jgi:hypothetical protein
MPLLAKPHSDDKLCILEIHGCRWIAMFSYSEISCFYTIWWRGECYLFSACNYHCFVLFTGYLIFPPWIRIWNSQGKYYPSFPDICFLSIFVINVIYLQVNPPFRFTRNIRSVKLPPWNYSAVTGTKARVSGWGHSQVVRASAAVMTQNKLLTSRSVRQQEVFLISISDKMFYHERIKLLAPSHLITDFIELRPSCEAANCATIKNFPNILWNLKVHCRVHKSPPLVPILNQINSVRTTPSYLSNIHFNIIHAPTGWSS